MKRAIFITGTDTDVGKTYISGQLVRLLREEGKDVTYFKGALSGAIKKDGRLIPGDALEVITQGGLTQRPEELVSYIYEDAVSPHLAARQLGQKPSLDRMYKDFIRLLDQHDGLVIEGSGGILCPLWLEEEKILLEDLIKILRLSVLIVGKSGLGAINHTVLTVSYCREKKIPVSGIILNQFDPRSKIHEDNLQVIEDLTGVDVVGTATEKGPLSLRKRESWWSVLEPWK